MAKRGGFPGMGMPGNMNNLMKQAQKMQRQMEENQKALEEKEFTAKMLCPKRRLLQIEELAEGCNGLLKVLKGKRGGPLAAVGLAHRVGDRAQLQKWQMLQK